ncbi:MAG: DUF3857 domain-containing protein [Planctomycetota bacterium]|nr:DUF3857 domain-containing protein [Planctomycetota bacterium]
MMPATSGSIVPAGESGGPVIPPALSADSGPWSPVTEKAFAKLIIEGDATAAEKLLAAAVRENPGDAPAQLGMCWCARLFGRHSEAAEHAAAALRAGASSRWAEVFLLAAVETLPLAKGRGAFLAACEAAERNPGASPAFKALVRRERAGALIAEGRMAEAAKLLDIPGVVKAWVIVGPFDNRDRSGFDAEYPPEKNVPLDLDAPLEGRTGKIRWFRPAIPDPTGWDGWVDLGELVEPNSHSAAYAATFARSALDRDCAIRIGCAGAVKVWINDRLAMTLNEYNDGCFEKKVCAAFLHKGWNKILVKSATLEGPWGFAVRLTEPDGRPLEGIEFDASPGAATLYAAGSAGRLPPFARAPVDEGAPAFLRTAVAAHPDNAFIRACLGMVLRGRRAGDREERLAEAEFGRAASLAPECPVFPLLYAAVAADRNMARQRVEAVTGKHPELAWPMEMLARFALEAGFPRACEDYCRHLTDRLPRTGGMAKCLMGYVLLRRGLCPEAREMLREAVAEYPLMPEIALRLAEATDAPQERRAVLSRALRRNADSAALAEALADSLLRAGMVSEAAGVIEGQAKARQTHVSMMLRSADLRLRAGEARKAAETYLACSRLAPGRSDVYEKWGLERLRAGDAAEAARLWEKALAIRPNNPVLHDFLREIRGVGTREFYADFQVSLGDFEGKIPSAEDFPAENVVFLLNQEYVRVNENGTHSRMRHVIAKVLREGGREAVRTHRIPYDPTRQTVEVKKASVTAPDGRETASARISDTSIPVTYGVETKIYDEYHDKVVTFPNVEVGSIVDLQYTIRDTGENPYGDYFADSFLLGGEHPVLRNQYILDIPAEAPRPFRFKAVGTDLRPREVPSVERSRKILVWERADSPGIPHEHMMPPWPEMVPSIQVSTFSDWNEVGAWYWNLSREQLAAGEGLAAKVAELAKGTASPAEKLKAAHDFVIKEVRYLGIEFGRYGYKPHRAEDTLRSLYGDCKDSAALLCAILKALGIEARLVLVRTVDDGAIPPDSLPSPHLFNHAIAYVPPLDGREYWIDCTTDTFALGEVPFGDQGAGALIVEPVGGRFVKVPRSSLQDNRIEISADFEVRPAGSASLAVRDRCRGQFAPHYRAMVQTPGRFRQEIETRIARRFAGASVKSLRFEDWSKLSTPMWAEYEAEIPSLATPSGDKKAMPCCYDNLRLTARYALQTERKHDLEIWYPWSQRVEISYRLPKEMKVVSMPDPVDVAEPFGFYRRTVGREGTTVRIVEEFVLSNPRIRAADYPAFRAFCVRVDALQEAKILLE